MDERQLRRRLRRGIFLCLIIGCVILGAGLFIIRDMGSSLNDMIAKQMQTETNEYKRRILRQMDRDYQTLRTLAAFMSKSEFKQDEKFDEMLYEANCANDFVTMAYFGEDGVGTMVNAKQGIRRNVDYRTLRTDVRKVIVDAYQGEQGVSQLFESEVNENRILVYAVPARNIDGEITGVLTASNDIEIFENLFEGDAVMDGNGEIHIVSTSGKVIVSSNEHSTDEEIDNLFQSSYFSEKDQKRIEASMENGESVFANINYNNKDFFTYINPIGVNGWYMMCVTNHRGANHVAYQMANTMGLMFILLIVVIVLLLVHICRMLVKNNRRLTSLVYVDRLTGADNSARFLLNLKTARTGTKKTEKISKFSVASVNVHQFKFVNEIFGADEADHLLKAMKKVIEDMLEEGEFFCREGADTFYLFLKETDEEVLSERIHAFMNRITEGNDGKTVDYQVTMYAGVFVYDESKEEKEIADEMLLTRSRFAMQHSKNFSGNHVHFYDSGVHKKEERENYIETHMHQALEKGEFRFFLQPKMDLKTGKLGGAEALVRWITEEGDMIFPDAFIPQFERNGFCVKLDMYMVEQACAKIRGWIDRGIEPIPISVNQSKLLFFEAGYIPTLEALIEKYRIRPEMITLEILEGLALEHASEINEKLKQLRHIGFSISMDDFGSGYASFNTLGNLEIDELKLDRSFLLEATKEKDGRFGQIMEHIVNLAKSLRISTVVEGVETEENERLIKELGCDFGQGYLYSRPISAEEFDKSFME